MTTYSNLAGTMSDSFAIGKRGVKLLQGIEAPTSALVAPIGSLYLKKSGGTVRVYQLVATEQWEPLLIAGSIPFLVASADENVPNALVLSTTGSLDFSPSTGVLKIANNPQFQGWGGLVPPKGSTLQRPASPIEGQFRFNTDENKHEVYANGQWSFLSLDTNTTPETYRRTLINSDLVDGKITATHGLNEKYVTVTVYDGSDYKIIPSGVRCLSNTQVEIDLSGYGPISGTWNIVVSR